jgi:hypothetical protein
MITSAVEDRFRPHLLLAIAALSLLSFTSGGGEYAWLKSGIRAVGGICGIAAGVEYTRRKDWPSEQEEVQQRLAELEQELLMTFERRWAIAEELHGEQIAALRDEIERLEFLRQQYEQEADRIIAEERQYLAEERQRMESERELLTGWIEQQQEELAQLEQAAMAQVEQRALEAEKRLEGERDYLIEVLEQQQEQYMSEAQAEIETRDRLIADLQNQLAVSIQIKRPKGNSRVEWVSDQLVTFFWDFKIPVDFKECTSVLNVDYIWLDPRQPVKMPQVREVVKEIPFHFDGIDGEPVLSMNNGTILLELKQSVEKTINRDREPLTLQGFDYFRQAVAESNHDLVAGSTDAGKSTLVSNLIDAASTIFVEDIAKRRSDWEIKVIPEVNVQIIDPKFPRTVWRINGRRVKPQYRGFEPWTDPDGFEHPCALDGLKAMDTEVRNRLERAMLADYNGELSSEVPLIFVSDESEQMVADYSSAASEPIRFTSRVGRSELVRAIVIGQSPLATSYGFKQKAALNNFTRWFLGDATIDRGIDEVCVSTVQRRRYRAELERLQKIATTDPSKQFYALVKFPKSRPVFVYLPPPGYFASRMEEVRDDEPVELKPLDSTGQARNEVLDLLDRAQAQNQLPADVVSRLNSIWEMDKDALIEQLPDDLKTSVRFAQAKGDWIGTSDLKQNRNAFKARPIEEIVECFERLVKTGLGEFDAQSKKYRYIEENEGTDEEEALED